MIFLTVGTQFTFDRLVMAVDDAVGQGLIDEELFAQIGQSDYQPRNFKAVASLNKYEFDSRLCQASAIISHAGMGSIAMAIEQEKPILVMPRQGKYGEVVNDHQVAIATRYEKMGHLLVAMEPADLPEKIEVLKNFVPEKRHVKLQPVLQRVHKFLENV